MYCHWPLFFQGLDWGLVLSLWQNIFRSMGRGSHGTDDKKLFHNKSLTMYPNFYDFGYSWSQIILTFL